VGVDVQGRFHFGMASNLLLPEHTIFERLIGVEAITFISTAGRCDKPRQV